MPDEPFKIGYFDEAYNTEFFVLGGWIFSRQEQAHQAAREFAAECAQYPVNPDFHMQPARDALNSQWDWGADCELTVAEKFTRRDLRFLALIDSILRHQPVGFYVVLDRNAYDRIYRGKVPKSRDSEYFVLFFHLLFGIAKHYVEAQDVEPLQPIFDTQDEFSPAVRRWFDAAVSGIAVHAPEAATILSRVPRFEHDSATPPLKAADMLTWLVLRLQANKLSDKTIGLLVDRVRHHGGMAGVLSTEILLKLRDLHRQDANALSPGEILAPL